MFKFLRICILFFIVATPVCIPNNKRHESLKPHYYNKKKKVGQRSKVLSYLADCMKEERGENELS